MRGLTFLMNFNVFSMTSRILFANIFFSSEIINLLLHFRHMLDVIQRFPSFDLLRLTNSCSFLIYSSIGSSLLMKPVAIF